MEVQQLRTALERGDAQAVRAFLDAHPEGVQMPIRWGAHGSNECSPLHYVANLRFHGMARDADTKELARILLAAGADPESRHSKVGGEGETPLQTAASLYEHDVAEALLEAGVDLEARGGCVDDGTALTLAVHFAASDVADLLVDRGAVVSDLPLAAGVGDIPRMRAVGAQGQPLERPLLYACINQRRSALDELVSWGADPKILVDGATLLHWCAWWAADQMIPHLLAAGVDPAIRDSNHGLTAEGWAQHRLAEGKQNGWPRAARLERIVQILES